MIITRTGKTQNNYWPASAPNVVPDSHRDVVHNPFPLECVYPSSFKQLHRQLLAVHVVLAGAVLDQDKASEVTEKFDLADDIG